MIKKFSTSFTSASLILYKLTILPTLLSFLILSFSCDDNPVNSYIQPGERDYAWTVDTLALAPNYITDITGTSPQDIWLCSTGPTDTLFYHYDGILWKPRKNGDGTPLSIYSISQNEVWSAGLSGNIWKYTNNVWLNYYQYPLSDTANVNFASIYGIAPNNIIAAGQYFIENKSLGIILKFNGIEWTEIIPNLETAFADIQLSDNGKIYLWGVSFNPIAPDTYQFYTMESNNTLKEIYSGFQSTNSEYGSLLQLGSKTYFIIGLDFFRHTGNKFEKVGRLSDDPKFRNLAWGRNEKDIFLGMGDGVAHFDGTNTVYIYQSSGNPIIQRGLIFDNDVFFLGLDNLGYSLLIHGKKKAI